MAGLSSSAVYTKSRTCDSPPSCDLLDLDMSETVDESKDDVVLDRITRAATPSEVEARTDIAYDTPPGRDGSNIGNGRDFTYQLRSAPYHRLEHPTDKSLFMSFIGSIVFLVVALALLCPGVLVYVVFLPLGYIVKRCCASCCCCAGNKCCCTSFVSQTDSFWLHDTPANAMVNQALFTLEKGLDIYRIKDLVNSKLVCAQSKSGKKLYPRFVQKVLSLYSGYAWVPDPSFSIDYHIFSMPETVSDERTLGQYIGEQASKALSRDKPLWEMHVQCNYGNEQDTLVLLRINPCVTDGISLVQILCKSLVLDQGNFILKPRFGRVAFAFNCMRAIFISPIVFLQKWLFIWKDRNLLHGPSLSGQKIVAWSEPFSMAKATRIKQVTRSTLNDILLTVAAGNIRTYLQKQGVLNPFDVHSFIPIDFRSDSTYTVAMGNQFAMTDVKLPTNTEGAIPRLWEVKHRMDDLKNTADPVVLYGCVWTLAYLLPHYLYVKVWRRIFNRATCFISSLQGPDIDVDFVSCQIKSMVSWMPAQDNIALSISFMAYADQLRMSVVADSAVVPDPEILTKDFIDQMDTLSILLANRRIPGEHSGRRLEASMSDDGVTGGEETSMEEIQKKMRDVQQQLQDLKSRLDIEAQEQYTMDERHLVNRVEELKEEFRELLTELRRKKSGDSSSVLSDDEDEEDGELRRSAYRRRSTSSISRRSLSSTASTTRPLTTSHHPQPPISPPPVPPQPPSPSTPSFTSSDGDSATLTSQDLHGKVLTHDRSTLKQETELSYHYSPQVERKC